MRMRMRDFGTFVVVLVVALALTVRAQQSCTTLFDSSSIQQQWQNDASSGALAIVSENNQAKLAYSNSDKAIFQVTKSLDGSGSVFQFQFQAVSGSASPSSVAIALVTGSSSEWIESSPQAFASSLNFDVQASNWKSEASGWSYSISVPNSNQVSRLAVILLSNSASSGAVYLQSVKQCKPTADSPPTTTTSPVVPPPPSGPTTPAAFVSRKGSAFSWGGCPFYYAGTNNYYMTYQSTFMVTDLLDNAQKMGFNVIRIWSFIDRGSLSQGNVIDSPFYFQYWDSANNRPAYNDGATGLERLDFIISEAAKRGLKILLVLTNNWREFGGMDQYSKWYGLSYHSDFYKDSRVKAAYKAWASHLINRKNTVTGKLYRDDPTIFAWELANEPRCKGSGDLGQDSSCNTQTITSWVQEMSAYVKSLDQNHMVSVGDEGFFNNRDSGDWIYNGSEGVDFDALLALSNIDFGTFHLYPSHWSKSPEWGVTYINEHAASGKAANKPVIAEEFGYPNSDRSRIYTSWTSAIETSGLAGSNFWMLAARENSNGQLYPDYDGFTIYNDGSDPSKILTKHAVNMAGKNSGCNRVGTNEEDSMNETHSSGFKWGVAFAVIIGVALVLVAALFIHRRWKNNRDASLNYRKFETA